jgi:hypothetical protein
MYYTRKIDTFFQKAVSISRYKMTEKRQLRRTIYIIRILQHFAMKLRNITNFLMLFHAVMKFFLDLSRSKFCSLGNNRSIENKKHQEKVFQGDIGFPFSPHITKILCL